MKFIFIPIAILFFLAGIEFLFMEMPIIISNAHLHARPLPLLLLLAAILMFSYGVIGVYWLVMGKTTPKAMRHYLLWGVITSVTFIVVGRLIGKYLDIRI
ncbi:MAG: hypothetical protein ABI758_06075 [Candidatus Woesebacteria bacterium]